MHHKKYTKKGSFLFRKGDKANTMLIITRGTVNIMINGRKVREMYVPEVLGEAAMIQRKNYRRTASAVVGSNGTVEILYLKKQDFDQLVSEGVIDEDSVQHMKGASIRWKSKKDATKVIPLMSGNDITKVTPLVSSRAATGVDRKKYLTSIRLEFGAGSVEYLNAVKSIK
jgi:CRP-like cAMP-binding protein